MLIFTESFLKEDFPDSLLDIDGFKFIRKDRAGSKPGGGIIFYYKSNISVSVIEDKNLSEAESLWVEIFNQKSKSSIIISAIYRPPSGNIRLFTDSLIDTIDTFNRNSTIVCLGDFNINFLEDSYSSNLLKSAINHLEFSVLNKFPTRVTDNSESLIDLILTNKPDNFFNTKTYFEDISDHFIISTAIKFSKRRPPRKLITKRSFKHFDAESFFNYCKYIPFHHVQCLTNLDEKIDFLNTNILNALDLFAPTKTFRVRGSKKPWITNFIKDSIYFKNHAFKIAKNLNNQNVWNKYKLIRNATNKLVGNAKARYYNAKLRDSNNSKKGFDIFNEIIKSSSSDINWHLFGDGQNNENILDIANALNRFFSSSHSSSSLPDSNIINPHLPNPTCEEFSFIPPTDAIISKLLSKLPDNFNSNPNEVPSVILKILAPLLIAPLKNIFTQSFNDASFSYLWKTGFVMPLKKVNNPKMPSDFRPITKISPFSKLIERIAFNQLNKYVEANNLLSDKQFGFRSKRSIDSLLLYLTSVWRLLLDQKSCPKIGIISLDIKKAFDNVNHTLLIKKLKCHFNISSSAAQWLLDYLSNRTLITKIGNIYSDPNSINRGIPQGGILSPLLFNLFINDLAAQGQIENLFLYADDCLIFNYANNNDDPKFKSEYDINLALK